jgi:hypothetical protein
MAEQPLETEEPGTDLPDGLVPPDEDALESADDSDGLMPPHKEPESSGRGGPVLLRERYLVDSGARLPEFDQPSAKAYAVEDRRDLANKVFALVCTPGVPVRMDDIIAFRTMDFPGVLALIEWEVVPWPPLGQSAMVVIYEKPLGGRVIDRLRRKDVRITEYDVPRRLTEPLIEGLQALNEKIGPHRALRPDNLYYLDEDMEEMVLGPHVTAPPGFDQPADFEPIDRATCQREGRGTGDIRDDVFALGVTIIHIVTGYNPVAKVKPENLIHQRLENGSYTALCGNTRLPLPLIEPLRSMLADDPAIRWNHTEVNNWVTGQKTNPVKKMSSPRAEVPFRFRKREHLTLGTLAWHFAQHRSDAVRAVQSDDFVNWIKRYPEGNATLETIRGAVQTAKFHTESYQGSDDYLVSKLSNILDPTAPIRYKNLAFMPDGFGPLLAVHWGVKGDPQEVAQLLAHDIPGLWFSSRDKLNKPLLDAQKNFAKLKSLLAINDPGYGLERVVYEANHGFACMSPLIAKNHVVVIEQLLPALEQAANSADTSSRPIDRHIAAFIASRFDQDIHPHLKALAAPKEDTSIIGMLSLLAFLQWKLRAPSMLALTSWVGGLLGPAINAYHNRHTRDQLEKEIPRLVRKGSLPEIFNLIDDAEKRQEDGEGFRAAQEEWLQAEEEIRDIEGAGEERLTKAERSGQQAAATISIMLGLTVVSILLVMEIM